jgi:hypothetical protein
MIRARAMRVGNACFKRIRRLGFTRPSRALLWADALICAHTNYQAAIDGGFDGTDVQIIKKIQLE